MAPHDPSVPPERVEFCHPEACPLAGRVDGYAARAVVEFAAMLRQIAEQDPAVMAWLLCRIGGGWSYAAIADRYHVKKQAVEQELQRRCREYPELRLVLGIQPRYTKGDWDRGTEQ
jgi:hypothetical protein